MNAWLRVAGALVVMLLGFVLLMWVAITLVHWFWTHPLW